MPELLRLLVVEDNEKDIAQWKNLVERHSVDDTRSFDLDPDFAASLKEAKHMVETRKFDAAVVDLGLKQDGEHQEMNSDGNEVVRLLASSELATLAIYTGQPNDWQELPAAGKVTVIEKGGGIDEVLTWLKETSDVALAIRDASRIIQSDMAVTFQRSIWPRWKQWREEGDSEEIKRAVARHLASHVYTELMSKTDKVHPEEHYYVPALESAEVQTGDLVLLDDGNVEVVITPRCDIAHQKKTKTIQLARCLDQQKEWDSFRDAQKDGAMKEMLQHDRKEVQHFIPRMTSDGKPNGPWFVRFDMIRSVERNGDEHKALNNKRIASISSDFLPSLVQRLGAFFSRIGTPDLNR